MKKLYLNTLLFLLFCIAGCSNQVEVVEEQYEDGTPKTIVVYEVNGDEKIEISSSSYYATGALKMTGGMMNGKRHGEWESFYPDGTTWSIGHYDEGVRTGKSTVYHSNGSIQIEGQFSKDDPVGTWTWFKENGEIDRTIDYSEVKN